MTSGVEERGAPAIPVAGAPPLRLLDLFCCEGGAGAGYARAGFEVVGVDVENRRRRYPFEFHQADALAFVAEHGAQFDVIHASPPCQAYSITRHSHDKTHPDLVGPTRDALEATGKPYVIENVVGAPLLNPITLCGAAAFGLTATDTDGTPLVLKRHRLFESNVWLWPRDWMTQHGLNQSIPPTYTEFLGEQLAATLERKPSCEPVPNV